MGLCTNPKLGSIRALTKNVNCIPARTLTIMRRNAERFLYIYKDFYQIVFGSNSFLNNLDSSSVKHSYSHDFLSDLMLLLIK